VWNSFALTAWLQILNIALKKIILVHTMITRPKHAVLKHNESTMSTVQLGVNQNNRFSGIKTMGHESPFTA